MFQVIFQIIEQTLLSKSDKHPYLDGTHIQVEEDTNNKPNKEITEHIRRRAIEKKKERNGAHQQLEGGS